MAKEKRQTAPKEVVLTALPSEQQAADSEGLMNEISEADIAEMMRSSKEGSLTEGHLMVMQHFMDITERSLRALECRDEKDDESSKSLGHALDLIHELMETTIKCVQTLHEGSPKDRNKLRSTKYRVLGSMEESIATYEQASKTSQEITE